MLYSDFVSEAMRVRRDEKVAACRGGRGAVGVDDVVEEGEERACCWRTRARREWRMFVWVVSS